MSESITHTAIVDDVLRIIGYADTFSQQFKDAAQSQKDLARLGGITRHGDRHNPGILENVRAAVRAGKATDADFAKLGFVIGWISHRATDRQFKRIFRAVDPDCPRQPTDCSVYHDAHLFRVLYENGNRDPYNPGTLNDGMTGHGLEGTVDVEGVEDLFKGMWRRMLIEMHTFIPDDDDIETWLERVTQTNQRLYVSLKRYAEAYADTQSDLYKRFIVDINFYNPDDPLLKLSAQLRDGLATSGGFDLAGVTKHSESDSQYAQALARSLRYVHAAHEYLLYEIEGDELSDRLDIGKPELDKVE